MTNQTKTDVQKSAAQWRAELSAEQYAVLRESATERPFTGALLKNKDSGMYTCGACGLELFGSDAKYDSGCGWPSFTHPETQANVTLIEDRTHGMKRTEVRCKRCDSHLGHVFDDGPGPAHTRYCINSLSLGFQKQP
ncbi:MAG: peptide-methionine (R)-S-oxide reductase MsrB [Candidatus Eremiobacteraeota bacterium]|nr:peptide-methionine (R)-S-oxide reductase MsrB [Candidatus Eremiobacteraeota bacterium]